MVLYIIKVLVVLVIFSIYNKSENALVASSTWGIIVTGLNLIFLSWGYALIISFVSFLIALGTFTLAEYLQESMMRLPALIMGMILMVLI